jgi:hypothetical protein
MSSVLISIIPSGRCFEKVWNEPAPLLLLPQKVPSAKPLMVAPKLVTEIQYGRFPTAEALFHTMHSPVIVSVLIAAKAPQETPDSTPR